MITAHMRKVYRAPTAGRDFMTLRAAVNKEADALIKKKYPTERARLDDFDGRTVNPGWHYTSDERLVRVHARLKRMLLRQLRKANP